MDKLTPFELFSSCVGARYTNNDDGSIGVLNTAYYSYFGWTGGPGTAYLLDVETPEGELYVTFGDD